MILGIASDSKKHAKIFDEVSRSLGSTRPKTKECRKLWGPIWETLTAVSTDIARRESIDLVTLHGLTQKLAHLEYSLGEEYQILVQLKTLQFMSKEVYQSSNVDLKHLQDQFSSIIAEEQEHREILLQIMELSQEKEEKPEDNTPPIKYQNPDAWFQVPPQAWVEK